MRVTERMIQGAALRHLQSQLEALAQVNEQIASGKRLNHPGEDPVVVEEVLNLRSDLETLGAYERTIDLSTGWVAATDSALRGLADLVIRGRNIALRGANAPNAFVFPELADEAEALLEEAVSVANSRYEDHYIFAGFQTDTKPFSLNTGTPVSVTYAGDSGAIEREIGPGDAPQINVSGDELLPVLNELATLVNALRAGDTGAIEDRLTAFDAALKQIATQVARTGLAANRVDEARERLGQARTEIQSVLSKLEDTDMAQASIELNARERAYLATLATIARRSRATLMDYLG